MASEIHMPGPVCLIENIDGKLTTNQGALKILSAITQPVVVVAIVGLYRTGKSYLMNKLAGKKTGFPLGSTVQSHTKGIWMWCVPHPNRPNQILVLLDTEGLGDVEKGDNQNDSWIFALAILLSSTFVYNSMGTINQQAIDQLHYVTELTDRIKAKSSPKDSEADDSADFVSSFPVFVWTLRDFSLELEANGEPITADEYLELSLKLKKGSDQKTKNFNEPRLCIQKFFSKKKCFIFDRPAPRKYLTRLEQLQEGELNPEFIEQTTEFCSYIFSHSKPKTLSGNITVNGPRNLYSTTMSGKTKYFSHSLVQIYVNAINSGSLPCIENAVLALAQIENSAAMQKAITHYDQQMGQKVQLPTETLQELLDLHRASQREAIKVFRKSSFKDVDQKFKKHLETQLEARWEDYCEQNMQASSDRCSALLQDIFSALEEEVNQGIYFKPGGHSLYIRKMERLKKNYYQKPRKGIQAEHALQKYLKSKESVSDAILQTDLTLTAKEKELEEERRKAEAARAEAQRLEAIQRQNQLMMERRARLHQEQVRRMQRDEENWLAEQRRIQEREIQEEAKRRKQILEAQHRRLQNEIHNLQRISNSHHDNCVLL